MKKDKIEDFLVSCLLYFLGIAGITVIILLLIALIKAIFFNWGVC